MDQVPASLLPYFIGTKQDYSSLQDSIIKINAVFLSLIILSTGSRFYVRFRMIRAAGLDDVLLIIAVVFAILLSTSCLIGEQFGLGKHLWNLDQPIQATKLLADIARITKVLFGCYLSYSSAISFIKFSIIATYLRIFPAPGKLRWLAYGIGVVVFCFWISSIFAVIFTCVPVNAAWDYSISNARCIDVVAYFTTAAGFNIGTDVLICVLPMPMFWSLKMPRSQRMILCMLFGIGLFACIASILRLLQLHHLNGIDISYQSVGSLNWSVIEVGTALICTSLTALRPLATKCFPSFGQLLPTTDITQNTKSLQGRTTLQSTSPQASQDDSGRIFVKKTFDVLEMEGLPSHPGKIKKKPSIYLAGRIHQSSNEHLMPKS